MVPRKILPERVLGQPRDRDSGFERRDQPDAFMPRNGAGSRPTIPTLRLPAARRSLRNHAQLLRPPPSRAAPAQSHPPTQQSHGWLDNNAPNFGFRLPLWSP